MSIFFREEFPLEEDQVDRSYGDAAVGEVEHGLEEEVSADEGDPVGPGPEGEVEHVHDLALHEGGVVAPGGDDAGGGLGEEEAVEQAVEDVSEGAGGDEGEADEDAGRDRGALVGARPPLEEPGDPHRQDGEQDDPEGREGVLADDAAERHAEGHALVLDEQDLEPVREDREGLPDGHVRLDQDLDDLVDDHEDGAEDQQAVTLGQFHSSRRRGRSVSSFPAGRASPWPPP